MTFLLDAIVVLIGEVLSVFLAPVAVCGSDINGRLPRWAWWMETHDNPGYSGPLSEGYPATRWGLLRWLWRNRAYALSAEFAVHPTQEQIDARVERGRRDPRRVGFSFWYGRIGDGWEFQPSLGLHWFRVYLRVGYKMQPFFDNPVAGNRPTAAGILIPFSIRSDDFGDN